MISIIVAIMYGVIVVGALIGMMWHIENLYNDKKHRKKKKKEEER